ncbi:MAG: lysine--tRNA ligase, partial [Candidatus Gracilibacteria bacterium]
GLPVYLDASKYREFMGKPLKDVPSPHEELGGKKAKNYAEYFAAEFTDVINSLGFEPEIIYSSSLYAKGHYDKWIAKILDHKDAICAIYKEVSGSEKPEDWYPLQVVCEKCGKVGTTKVTGWDSKAETVSYECMPDLVDWAQGCGHKGVCSPFGGRGKLPWKVEWPVKWSSMNVDIEGAGKDHNAAGGSHEIGERICRECLEMSVPFNIPYEFFLFGGAKMSSSKGMGASVTEVAETIPPELLRFLMVRKRPNHPIDFDPFGPTIPVLFDEHDKSAAYYFGEAEGEFPNMERVFHFSQIRSGKGCKAGKTSRTGKVAKMKAHFYPRFMRVAFFEQIPHVDIFDEMQKIKGKKLTKDDKDEIGLRKHYAKLWLDKFAPDAYRFEIQQEIPETASHLSDEQKKLLSDLASILEEKDWAGEDIHGKIHELKEASPLSPKEVFGAIYVALLGKESGPQAGWFLEALDKKFLIKRFREISKS